MSQGPLELPEGGAMEPPEASGEAPGAQEPSPRRHQQPRGSAALPSGPGPASPAPAPALAAATGKKGSEEERRVTRSSGRGTPQGGGGGARHMSTRAGAAKASGGAQRVRPGDPKGGPGGGARPATRLSTRRPEGPSLRSREPRTPVTSPVTSHKPSPRASNGAVTGAGGRGERASPSPPIHRALKRSGRASGSPLRMSRGSRSSATRSLTSQHARGLGARVRQTPRARATGTRDVARGSRGRLLSSSRLKAGGPGGASASISVRRTTGATGVLLRSRSGRFVGKRRARESAGGAGGGSQEASSGRSRKKSRLSQEASSASSRRSARLALSQREEKGAGSGEGAVRGARRRPAAAKEGGARGGGASGEDGQDSEESAGEEEEGEEEEEEEEPYVYLQAQWTKKKRSDFSAREGSASLSPPHWRALSTLGGAERVPEGVPAVPAVVAVPGVPQPGSKAAQGRGERSRRARGEAAVEAAGTSSALGSGVPRVGPGGAQELSDPLGLRQHAEGRTAGAPQAGHPMLHLDFTLSVDEEGGELMEGGLREAAERGGREGVEGGGRNEGEEGRGEEDARGGGHEEGRGSAYRQRRVGEAELVGEGDIEVKAGVGPRDGNSASNRTKTEPGSEVTGYRVSSSEGHPQKHFQQKHHQQQQCQQQHPQQQLLKPEGLDTVRTRSGVEQRRGAAAPPGELLGDPPSVETSLRGTMTTPLALPTGLRGLNNLGSTCFMNAVLQVQEPTLRDLCCS